MGRGTELNCTLEAGKTGQVCAGQAFSWRRFGGSRLGLGEARDLEVGADQYRGRLGRVLR